MSWFVPSFWGSMLGTQHLEDAVIKAAQKQGMSVLLCSDGKRQAEAVRSVCGSGWSYCLRAQDARMVWRLFAKKCTTTCINMPRFFLFLIFICFLLANQSLRIFGHKLKAVTSPCLFVQAVTSNFAFSGGGVGEAIREGLFKAGRCGSWDWDSGLGRLEMSIFHLGNRWTMCPLIGSCQRLAWWFVMVVLGQPFVPLEQVPLRLKFIHLALSSKRVEFSFNWHTQIWELSSYPRCIPRGHTRYPETMIINHKYITYILSSKKIGVWSSLILCGFSRGVPVVICPLITPIIADQMLHAQWVERKHFGSWIQPLEPSVEDSDRLGYLGFQNSSILNPIPKAICGDFYGTVFAKHLFGFIIYISSAPPEFSKFEYSKLFWVVSTSIPDSLQDCQQALVKALECRGTCESVAQRVQQEEPSSPSSRVLEQSRSLVEHQLPDSVFRKNADILCLHQFTSVFSVCKEHQSFF